MGLEGGGGGCIYKIVIAKGGTIFLCNYLGGGGSFDTPHFSEPLPWDVKNDQFLILLLNQNPSLHNSCDAKNWLYKSSCLVYGSSGIIDMLSTEGFLPSRRKGLLQHTFNNEMSSLARLAFTENLLTGQEISVHCKSFAQGQRKLSVITRCPC